MTKRATPSFTNLGMHFVVAGSEVVLVQVEVNVRGLLAVHSRRLIKSKRGTANLSQGTVRMSIATPDDQERAHSAYATVQKCDDYDRMAQENIGLHARCGQLERMVQERVMFSREWDGSGI